MAKQIFWGPLAPGPHGEWAALPDAEGPEWVSLVFLSALLILFGLVPGLALSRDRPGDRGPARPDRGAPVMLLALELGVAALALVVFVLGLGGARARAREVGLVTAVGLAGLYGLSLLIDARGPLFDGAFVVDALAVFLKQIFLLATLLAVVGGLARRDTPEDRRALEYHLLVLTSLLGMMILASARELVLLFVAFELMSIPLYVLAGFAKRDARAVEASLKFFLVGSLSTALLAYGLSFVYGVTGSTRLDVVARAAAGGDPLLILGLLLVLGGVGFKIAAFPFHMWVPDTYEAAATPFVAWLSVAPKAAGFAALLRIFVERAGPTASLWAGSAARPRRAHASWRAT